MTTALKLPPDSKERIEGLMKYSDLMGYKKDEVESDNTDTINFFLPLKCDKCPLLAAYECFPDVSESFLLINSYQHFRQSGR